MFGFHYYVSEKYGRMITDLYFISGLLPDLAQYFHFSFILQVHVDGCHFGYKLKFLKRIV